MVLSNWNSFDGSIPDKLQFMGQQLQHWSKLKNREQGCSLSDIEKCLQELYGMDPSDEVLKEIMEVQLDLNLEIDKEEIFWEQQAWANWLKHGDRNTSFFHKATVQRFYRNRILGLECEDGSRILMNEEMFQHASRYFELSIYLRPQVLGMMFVCWIWLIREYQVK